MPSRLNRRDLLTAMLGAPLAVSGCAEREMTLPPGELLGASDEVGHRLRNRREFTVPEERWRRCRVAIVGGGVAGLSAARRLARAGMEDFVLLELENVAGGTSRSGRNRVCGFPWGAHYVPVPTRENPALVELFDEMGFFEDFDAEGNPIAAEQFRVRYPDERVFYRGTWYEGLYLRPGASPEDLRQLAAFRKEVDRWVGWRDGKGRRAFSLPMAAGSDDAEVTVLDRLSMAEWMDRQGFTSPRLRWLIDYACRDDYGLRLDQTSAWAALFYFASRKSAAGGPSQPFLTWPEGNGRIVSRLAGPLHKQIELGWMAARVAPRLRDGRQEVEIVAVHRDGGVRGYRAERVIFAAPQFLVPYVIRFADGKPRSHVAAFEYGAWAVVNLTLRENAASRGFPLAWDNVLYESPSLGYVSATHQRCLDHGPAVWTWYYPLADNDPKQARRRLLSLDREEWAETALSDLGAAHPEIRALAERADVMRWGHAMILPRPGFLWGGDRQAAAAPQEGIHFAHSDLSGVALFEEAFDRGTRAAEDVLQALEVPSSSIL